MATEKGSSSLDLCDFQGARPVVPAVGHEAVDVAWAVVRDRGALQVEAGVERHLGRGRRLGVKLRLKRFATLGA